MNTRVKLLERSLELFSVKSIRDYFVNAEGDRQEKFISDVINRYSAKEIMNFVTHSINYTKQHVYIFKISDAYHSKLFPIDKFPIPIESAINTANGIDLYCVPTIEFTVLDTKTLAKSNVKFHQPMLFSFWQKYLIVKATILEKSLSAYVGSKNIVSLGRDIDETQNIDNVLLFLAPFIKSIVNCDVNKGVKHLLNTDVLDVKSVRFKRAKSVSQETMDEGFTLKKTYPVVYNEMMKSPIRKTVFSYLYSDDLMPSHFTGDPTIGEFSIQIFPKNENQINYVLNTILGNN